MNSSNNNLNTEISSVGEVIKDCYRIYGTSVVIARAIPNIIDGLKPVQKRILYTLYRSNYTRDFVKSISVCADTQKYFHPHGEISVYSSLVKLAQPFNTRLSVIETQGNWGSTDKDDAAAPRYTACRAGKLLSIYTDDFKYQTVPFWLNDSSVLEPTFLPARLPMLLVNGANGIAVGYATTCLPHNPEEIVSYIEGFLNSDGKVESWDYIKGPDFPTGGVVIIDDSWKEICNTGKGSIICRGNYRIVKLNAQHDEIHFFELPYRVGTSEICEQVASLAKNKSTPEELVDFYDASGKTGLDLTFVVKNGSADLVLSWLFRNTNLSFRMHYNIVALLRDVPVICSFKTIIKEFLDARLQITIRSLMGRIQELDTIIDDTKLMILVAENSSKIISIIKKSKDPYSELLTIKLKLSTKLRKILNNINSEYYLQSNDIKKLMSYSISRLSSLKVSEAYDGLILAVNERKDKFESTKNRVKLKSIMLQDIREALILIPENIRSRKTQFITSENAKLKAEKRLYMITENWIMIAIDPRDINKTYRGAKGKDSAAINSGVWIGHLLATEIFAFTSKGRIIMINLESLSHHSYINLKEKASIHDDEIPVKVMNRDEIKAKKLMLMISLNGNGKLVRSEVLAERSRLLFKLKKNDSLIDVIGVEPSDRIIIYSNKKAFILRLTDIRISNPATGGVVIMRLKKDNFIVRALVLNDSKLMVVYDKGFARMDDPNSYKETRRGSSGMLATFKNFEITDVVNPSHGKELILLSSAGNWIRSDLTETSSNKRRTKGIKFQNLSDGDKIRLAIVV